MMMEDSNNKEAGGSSTKQQSKFNLELKIDKDYFKRGPGIIKLIQLVFGLVLVCLPKPFWLVIPVCLIFMMTAGWSWLYFLGIQRKIGGSLWNKIELYYTGGAAVVYGVVTVVSLVCLRFTLAVLGSQCTVAYLAGALVHCQKKPQADEPDSESYY